MVGASQIIITTYLVIDGEAVRLGNARSDDRDDEAGQNHLQVATHLNHG